jgi:hypothetical protein
MVRSSLLAGALLGLLLVQPAFAFGLTQDDFVYLSSLGIQENNPAIQNLSPRQGARIHNLINADWSKNDPVARAKSVHEALAEVIQQHRWEEDNPGKLWNSSKR